MTHDIRKFMAICEGVIQEDGRVVQGVNTTCDVSTDEIKTQAAKFGNHVDRDGVPIYTLSEDEELDESDSPVPIDNRPEMEDRFKALFSKSKKKKR
jgi:hypothetical protein